MNEEEKKMLKIFKTQVEKEQSEYFTVNTYTQLLYDSHKTVLNLIEKQQAEKEDCKKCVLRDEVHNYIEELEKKEKIIDLMAEKINQAYFEEDDFYEWFEKMLGVQKQIDYGYVVDLIKQYFERGTK